jgi:benzoate-CoA ligase
MAYESARSIGDLPVRYNAAEDLVGTNLAAGRGRKTAIIDCHGRLTYAELAKRVDRMAGAVAALGLARGDRVLLCLCDTRAFPTAFLGAIKAGVVPVPLNTLLTAEDYAWILANSEAKAVLASGAVAEKWSAIAAGNPRVRFVSSDGGPWQDLEAVLAEAAPAAAAAPTGPGDVAFWLYTSGSTGKPKGAMHRQGSLRLTANLYGLGTAGVREDDVVLSVAKQFFAYGLGNALTFPYAAGATTVLHHERPTVDAIGELVVRHGVTVLAAVPTFFAGLLASPACPARDEAPRLRLAISAGEALPAHLGEAFRDRFAADILDGLGSTEMLHIFISQRPGQVRYGCTGRPVDGYEVRLVTDAGEEAGVGEIGNLQICGPTSATGYWGNPAKTAETFVGEWTVSGDKYIRDAEDWYTYAGRVDDMLKVGGIYVSPIEVEEALASHPCVLETAVVGTVDTAGLVKPHAYVVLGGDTPASEATAAMLKAHVKALLAPYKYPRWISFVDELPNTATGNIQRFRLRQVC